MVFLHWTPDLVLRYKIVSWRERLVKFSRARCLLINRRADRGRRRVDDPVGRPRGHVHGEPPDAAGLVRVGRRHDWLGVRAVRRRRPADAHGRPGRARDRGHAADPAARRPSVRRRDRRACRHVRADGEARAPRPDRPLRSAGSRAALRASTLALVPPSCGRPRTPHGRFGRAAPRRGPTGTGRPTSCSAAPRSCSRSSR